jgi:hypothetical protein
MRLDEGPTRPGKFINFILTIKVYHGNTQRKTKTNTSSKEFENYG